MLIACAPRATSYFVEPASLQRNGRRVRCSSVWRNESNRAARLMAAAETLAPDALVPEALVVPRPPNSRAAPAQSLEVPAEVAAVNDAPDAPAVGQEAAEGAPGEVEPADAEPAWPETVADHKDIETDAACRFGRGAEQHVWRLSQQQSSIILTLIMLDSVVVGWRKDIVRAPSSDRLPPRQTIAFASRLASPSAGSSDVPVHFLNRRNLSAHPR